MRIVFEYTHLYIRMQTNIHKNEKPYLFAAIEVEEITSNQQRWVRWVLKCLHFTFWAHDYLCRWAHDYLYRLIPVEFGDRSCPYKVKWRSGFQIVRYHSTNISIRIRDPIVVNTFVFTTYCIRESPTSYKKNGSTSMLSLKCPGTSLKPKLFCAKLTSMGYKTYLLQCHAYANLSFGSHRPIMSI